MQYEKANCKETNFGYKCKIVKTMTEALIVSSNYSKNKRGKDLKELEGPNKLEFSKD